MISPDDRALLGIAPQAVKVRRPSAVSQILRAITDDLEQGPPEWELPSDEEGAGFCMLVASDRKTRGRAYALAHRVYSGRGYVAEEEGMIVSPHDPDPDTLTLLAQDEDRRDAATITLVFDSHGGLPCDEIYGEELNALRSSGRRPGGSHASGDR